MTRIGFFINRLINDSTIIGDSWWINERMVLENLTSLNRSSYQLVMVKNVLLIILYIIDWLISTFVQSIHGCWLVLEYLLFGSDDWLCLDSFDRLGITSFDLFGAIFEAIYWQVDLFSFEYWLTILMSITA